MNTYNEFETLGLDDFAYIKKEKKSRRTTWTIYAADGTRLGQVDDEPIAKAFAVQHDLEPFSVH